MHPKTAQRHYICPGESQPISRAVHLARMAAYYPKCRECPLKSDVGQWNPLDIIELEVDSPSHRQTELTMVAGGVRGRYLNQITRAIAGRIAARFAHWLWQLRRKAIVPVDDDQARLAVRPTVVVGRDDRPFSADISSSVTSALRQMGCHVTDVRRTSAPCFRYAVSHLEADGGLQITGAGMPPSWTGMDFIGSMATCLSAADVRTVVPAFHELSDTNEAPLTGLSRPVRQAGDYTTFDPNVPYEAILRKRFHILPSKHVCIAVSSEIVGQQLTRLFEEIACELTLVELPTRPRALHDKKDDDVQRCIMAVKENNADMGLVFDDGASRCAVIDERGRLIHQNDLAIRLTRSLSQEHPQGVFCIDSRIHNDVRISLQEIHPHWQEIATDSGHISTHLFDKAMRAEESVFGVDTESDLWFRQSVPVRDAILTTAKLIHTLNSGPLSACRSSAVATASELT